MNPKYEQFKQLKNLRQIANNEIVFDIDNREVGFIAINFIGIALYKAGYNFKIYYSEGQKSPHLHIKNIPYLESLTPEQLKSYKEAIIKKYTPIEYLPYADFTLCSKHLVAEEDKPHFKYGTIKKLCGVFNEDKINFCEQEIYNQVTLLKPYNPYNPQVTGIGITARITQAINIKDIAEQYGLTIHSNKTLCPFHPDNKTESLVFYERQGRFYCFGCQQGGNIIKFYAMLKELNPNFIYKKQEKENV